MNFFQHHKVSNPVHRTLSIRDMEVYNALAEKAYGKGITMSTFICNLMENAYEQIYERPPTKEERKAPTLDGSMDSEKDLEEWLKTCTEAEYKEWDRNIVQRYMYITTKCFSEGWCRA